MKGNITLKGSRPVTLLALFSKVIGIFAIFLPLLCWSVTQKQISKSQAYMVIVASAQISLHLLLIQELAVCYCYLFTKETLETNFLAL